LAKKLEVDALTIGGDLYEDGRVSQDTARFLAEQLGDLPCPVLISPGNHDFWHRGSLYASNDWPTNVHVFETSEFTPFEVSGYRVFGVAHQKPKGTGNLLQGVRVPDGLPALALFHGSEQEGMPFQEEGKEDHAPFKRAELEKSGFQFGLLGHFHTPRQTDQLVYPGNPEPLTFGEAGERGAVEIEFAGGTPKVTVHKVNTFTLSEIEVDVSQCQHSDALVRRLQEALPGGKDQGARVTLVGELALGIQIGPTELLRRLREGDRCVELVYRTRPALDLEELLSAKDVRGEFTRGLMARDDKNSDLVQQALRCGIEALRGEEPALL
ncbi:MAG: metallophosphoesterase family protein, partial [Candidatus Dormibacteria bacterium]